MGGATETMNRWIDKQWTIRWINGQTIGALIIML